MTKGHKILFRGDSMALAKALVEGPFPLGLLGYA